MEHDGERKTPAWVWVLLGCSIPVLLIVVFVGVAAFFGLRMAKQATESPDQRTERAKEALGAEALPDGYHAALCLSVPFVFEMVMLTDRPFDPDRKDNQLIDKHGLMYVKSIRGNNERKVRDFIDGKADPSELLGQGNIRLGRLEPIARGSFPGAGGTLHWAANRGDLQAHGNNIDGLVTLAYVECAEDSKFRIAIWFGEDPQQGEGSPKADLTGTIADEAEIRRFLSQFKFCR